MSSSSSSQPRQHCDSGLAQQDSRWLRQIHDLPVRQFRRGRARHQVALVEAEIAEDAPVAEASTKWASEPMPAAPGIRPRKRRAPRAVHPSAAPQRPSSGDVAIDNIFELAPGKQDELPRKTTTKDVATYLCPLAHDPDKPVYRNGTEPINLKSHLTHDHKTLYDRGGQK